MNKVPSSAIENGLIAQLMNKVTPTPFQCWRTLPKDAKSILSSIGMIISQISAATMRLTCATSADAIGMQNFGRSRPRPITVTMHKAEGKSVATVKSVYVRVGLGGRRKIKQKNK